MLDTLTMYNRDDFNQRYSRSYGWFIHPETGVKTLVYVKKVDRDKVTFETTTGEYYAYSGTNVQFEFLPITRGWFSCPVNGPVLLQRVPAKQFSRGISDSNTSVYSFSSTGALLARSITLTILNEVFNTPPAGRTTFADFTVDSNRGFVLSPYFLLHRKRLYFYDAVVGEYANGIITLTDNLIFQELQDCINRNNYQLRIV